MPNGNLKNRSEILNSLKLLPSSMNVDHDEIMIFIENNIIMGQGLGYIDIALLVSSILTSIPLWTLDKRLYKFSEKLGLNYFIKKK